MFCSCGRPQLLTEDDADLKAINDLKKQAGESSGAVAALLKTRVEQLRAEVSAEKSFRKGLRQSQKEIIDAISLSLETVSPQTLMSLTNEQLIDLMLQGGLGRSIDQFIEDQDKIRNSISSLINTIEPSFNFDSINQQIDLIALQSANSVFDEVVIPSFQKNIKQALRDATFTTSVKQAMSNLQSTMKRSEGSILTEVRTKISQYGRSITATAGAAAGLNHFLYTGALDGITRNFCRALVNKVVTSQQMNQLNNNQGLSVITSGGGYNCRHSWSPVSLGFIKSAKLDLATNADIKAANRGAKERKK
jgi:hypothetical protein